MVARPVFTAPIADQLTGDRIRSSRDSRLVSGRVLWAYRRSRIYELVADNMSMIVREKALAFLRIDPNTENVTGIGGTVDHIWLLTHQHIISTGHHINRLYDLNPIDFSVRREEIILESTDRPLDVRASGVDGDNELVHVGFLRRDPNAPGGIRGEWRQYNATFSTLAIKNIGTRWPTTIAGDSSGVWIKWRNALSSDIGIVHYRTNGTFVRDYAMPLASADHLPIAIGGGSKRMYYRTVVAEEDATEEWPAGNYIHTIKPETMAVVRSYGPMLGDPNKRPAVLGGK